MIENYIPMESEFGFLEHDLYNLIKFKRTLNKIANTFLNHGRSRFLRDVFIILWFPVTVKKSHV